MLRQTSRISSPVMLSGAFDQFLAGRRMKGFGLALLISLGATSGLSATITDLGTLGGGPVPSSTATGINNSGQVVGYSLTPGNANHSFLWTAGGGMKDLGTLAPGAVSVAWAINNTGQVVGVASTPTSGGRPFLYSGGVMTDLGTLGGSYGVASSINSAGQIVGTSFTAGDASARAFLYSGGIMTAIPTVGTSCNYCTAATSP